VPVPILYGQYEIYKLSFKIRKLTTVPTNMFKTLTIVTLFVIGIIGRCWAFIPAHPTIRSARDVIGERPNRYYHTNHRIAVLSPFSKLRSQPDPQIIALVAGQENYGLAIVAIGEAVWSFLEAPSLDHAKVFVPAAISSLLLFAVSGPMITSGNLESAGLGLGIATFVSLGLTLSYIARLGRFSPSKKEIVFLGLLFAVAGILSFGQNLVVDGFISIPSISFPSIFPQNEFDLPESAYMIN